MLDVRSMFLIRFFFTRRTAPVSVFLLEFLPLFGAHCGELLLEPASPSFTAPPVAVPAHSPRPQEQMRKYEQSHRLPERQRMPAKQLGNQRVPERHHDKAEAERGDDHHDN